MDSALEGSNRRSASDWPTEKHRTYAKRLQALSAACDVECSSRVVETDAAGRIHYLAAGPQDGKPVLLLHGAFVPGATWLPMLPALVDKYRLYVPDRPGIGLSEPYRYTPDNLRPSLTSYLIELLDTVGLDCPNVVGNSLGGLQALLLAIEHDRARRLGLVGSVPGLSSNGIDFTFKLLGVPALSRLIYWFLYRDDSPEGARGRVEDLAVVDSSAIPRELFELLAAHQKLPDTLESERSLGHAQFSRLRQHDLFDLADDVVALAHPTCFVWGTEDEFWKPAVGRQVAEQMADAEFHTLENHGHVPWLEPDEGASEPVRAFLDR